jgi:hypothetical protein
MCVLCVRIAVSIAKKKIYGDPDVNDKHLLTFLCLYFDHQQHFTYICH